MSIFQPKTDFVIRARRANGAPVAHANDAVYAPPGSSPCWRSARFISSRSSPWSWPGVPKVVA